MNFKEELADMLFEAYVEGLEKMGEHWFLYVATGVTDGHAWESSGDVIARSAEEAVRTVKEELGEGVCVTRIQLQGTATEFRTAMGDEPFFTQFVAQAEKNLKAQRVEVPDSYPGMP